jgi:O-methyltransferase
MEDSKIIEFVSPYTMLSRERIQNILDCIATLEKENIPGDFLEIGVFKGGAIMAMALKCIQLSSNRKIIAYDTFDGMTTPTSYDVSYKGLRAEEELPYIKSLFTETQANIDKTGYSNVEYVIGDILLQKKEQVPKTIALLRLDTDWYESTRHELDIFEPNVSKDGFVVIDDYGHWLGCKKAVDEFLQIHPYEKVSIDYTGIYWRKT